MLWFITILLIISLLLDYYTFQGVKAITGDHQTRGRGIRNRTIHLIYWLIFAGTSVALIISILLPDIASGGIPSFTQWMINIFITLLVTKLAFALVLLIEDIYRILATAFNAFRRKNKEGPLMPGRRKFISQLGVVIAGIPFLSFIYGIAKGKYDYTVHRHTIYFEDLPKAFDGFTITQLSDIHSGSFDNADAVQKGIDLVKSQQTDLVVFTGDLVNNFAGEITPWISHFNQIKSSFGQFSILGNHDYGEYVDWKNSEEKVANFEKVKQQHKMLDYRLLLNENISIEKEGQKIDLIGVENWGIGFIKRGDLDKALQGTDENSFKILLSHDPSHWEEIVKNHPKKIQLTLSGHTHGMQCGIETPTVKWSPVQLRYPHWAGLKTENNRSLYINRGFGFIGFSGRVGIWPEITVIELRKGQENNNKKPQIS
jgi:predicted MPP superfamily phosphohydrolase